MLGILKTPSWLAMGSVQDTAPCPSDGNEGQEGGVVEYLTDESLSGEVIFALFATTAVWFGLPNHLFTNEVSIMFPGQFADLTS